jgi:selenophosphate synthetase-related protein
VLHRDRSYSGSAEVIVDVWRIAQPDEFDLLDWMQRNPGLIILAEAGQEQINASISGVEAVFQFEPASGMIGDLAQLTFADGQHVFSIVLTNGAIPALAEDREIYVDSLPC